MGREYRKSFASRFWTQIAGDPGVRGEGLPSVTHVQPTSLIEDTTVVAQMGKAQGTYYDAAASQPGAGLHNMYVVEVRDPSRFRVLLHGYEVATSNSEDAFAFQTTDPTFSTAPTAIPKLLGGIDPRDGRSEDLLLVRMGVVATANLPTTMITSGAPVALPLGRSLSSSLSPYTAPPVILDLDGTAVKMFAWGNIANNNSSFWCRAEGIRIR